MTVESVVRAGPEAAGPAGDPLPLRVDEELLLLTPDGEVADAAPEVLGAVAQELPVRPRSAPHLVGSTADAGTPLGAIAGALSIARRALAEAAADQGARLVALGTAPFDGRREVGPVRESTCACRISVAVPSPALGAAVLERCRGWLPTLLALSGNSALWRGRDTGWSSTRFLLGTAPAGGGAPAAEWLRLTPQQDAVEFLIADTCPTVADAVLLAALCRALTATALADEAVGRPRPQCPDRVVTASAHAAARWGLGTYLLDPSNGGPAPAVWVLTALVDAVTPALGASGDLALVRSLLAGRLRDGSGAERQRALHRRVDRRVLVQCLANSCAGVDQRR
ncbi:carboxylate-amine ligase [Blastococcus sp. SYSU D01042]